MSKPYKSNSKRVAEVWLGHDKQWYFRVKCRKNGELVAASTQGYSRRIDCIATAKLVTGGRLKITIIK
jgi:uncharacterized protein YegP (UPF0339 family)